MSALETSHYTALYKSTDALFYFTGYRSLLYRSLAERRRCIVTVDLIVTTKRLAVCATRLWIQRYETASKGQFTFSAERTLEW